MGSRFCMKSSVRGNIFIDDKGWALALASEDKFCMDVCRRCKYLVGLHGLYDTL